MVCSEKNRRGCLGSLNHNLRSLFNSKGCTSNKLVNALEGTLGGCALEALMHLSCSRGSKRAFVLGLAKRVDWSSISVQGEFL